MGTEIVIPEFITATLGFAVFLVGARLTAKLAFLRNFNIPEPVTGGLLAAFLFGLFQALSGFDLVFSTTSRDMFLVLFFASIGLNARISDLKAGGWLLVLLLMLTVIMIVGQNAIGVVGATLFGFPSQSGVLFGSASLIGGHGTSIAWAPQVAQTTGLIAAPEIGVAVATIGLVLAALVGGPIAKFLVERNSLTPSRPDEEHTVGRSHDDKEGDNPITHVNLMRVFLALNSAVVLGYLLDEAIEEIGVNLPLFVSCMVMGIIIGNVAPYFLPKDAPVSRTPSLAVISEFTLGAFLAISLMALDIASLKGLGGPIILILGLQMLFAVLFVIYVLFPVLGRNYRAAVLAAGFGGFSLGATPTAIANMTAVTKRYGPSPISFVVLPLVSAFFVDIANAIVIQMIVNF
ncbi:glutamate:Na+ symporter, ESS family [Shimia gijangensis]|uniref:Sodium/glutamate symporter n=1 Tax=Shimia gijangensis TaxID=1470563 RepID=A0A1M6D4S7_9RHOB|nr:sodium/glutamate symporter [Shimia gijangensis]SHI68094.1 glutamate:Na+ symporter, ESS family [Shimia gijangensis]